MAVAAAERWTYQFNVPSVKAPGRKEKLMDSIDKRLEAVQREKNQLESEQIAILSKAVDLLLKLSENHDQRLRLLEKEEE